MNDNKMENIKAIIFDMDGVILDSESISDITWKKAAEEKGLFVNDEILNACRGSNKNDTIQTLKKYYGQDFDSEAFLERTSELFHEIEEKDGIPLLPKPNPEIYLMACKSIGMNPEDCAAIEDSLNGIRSAYAAGLHPIMVIDKVKPTEEIKKMCCNIFDSLDGLKSVL